MTEHERLQSLVDHLAWSNDALFTAIEQDPTNDAILKAANHILAAEEIWLSRIDGSDRPPVPWPSHPLAELKTIASRNVDALRSLLARTDGDALARIVEYRNLKGEPFQNRLDDILFHVIIHGAYHRGQVNMLLRQGGNQPVSIDYIVYLRKG